MTAFARITTEFLLQYNIDLLPWPSMSPDLSVIEHLWDQLGQRISAHPHPPRNVAELRQVVQAESKALPQYRKDLPQYRINTLIRSM